MRTIRYPRSGVSPEIRIYANPVSAGPPYRCADGDSPSQLPSSFLDLNPYGGGVRRIAELWSNPFYYNRPELIRVSPGVFVRGRGNEIVYGAAQANVPVMCTSKRSPLGNLMFWGLLGCLQLVCA